MEEASSQGKVQDAVVPARDSASSLSTSPARASSSSSTPAPQPQPSSSRAPSAEGLSREQLVASLQQLALTAANNGLQAEGRGSMLQGSNTGLHGMGAGAGYLDALDSWPATSQSSSQAQASQQQNQQQEQQQSSLASQEKLQQTLQHPQQEQQQQQQLPAWANDTALPYYNAWLGGHRVQRTPQHVQAQFLQGQFRPSSYSSHPFSGSGSQIGMPQYASSPQLQVDNYPSSFQQVPSLEAFSSYGSGSSYSLNLQNQPVHPNQLPIGLLVGQSLPETGQLVDNNQYGFQPRMGPQRSVEFNINKAITKRLASAVHYQQVLDCISDSVHQFDEVNVATALHRLAKLQPPNLSHQPPSIIYTNQFQQICYAIRTLLDRFEAQAVSNTLWAFATLGYQPEGDLLERIANHATAIIGTFKPQATSNTLWAFAKFGTPPPDTLLVAAAAQMVQDLPKSVPQDISNTLWAYATLRKYPGPALLEGAATQAALSIGRFKPQEVANTLWSYATLGHDPGAELLNAMAAHVAKHAAQFRPQAISNSLWAYAKLGFNPGHEVLDIAGRRALQSLHQYSAQEVSNCLWAFATLEHHPGVPLLDAAAIQVSRRMERFSPQDTTNSVWSYAKLFHYPCNDLLQSAALYCLRHWHRFKPQEVANLLWALAVLKACTPDTWRLLLSKLAGVPVNSFDDADKHQLFQCYMLMDKAVRPSSHGAGEPEPAPATVFPKALLDSCEAVWRAGVAKTGRISKLHEEVSHVLWRLGIIHTNEYVTPDGLFLVDIALQNEKVVLEVDGPSHFSVNSHRPLGRTIGRRCMLESAGFIVRSIPFYEWDQLGGFEQQAQYLTRVLASACTV